MPGFNVPQPLFALFGLSWKLWTCKWGTIHQALFSLKYLEYPKWTDTTPFRSHSHFRVRKWQSNQLPLPMVQSSHYPSNLCSRSERRHKKNNSTGANWELLMWVLLLLSQKEFPGPLSNGLVQRGNTFASVFREGQFKHGKFSAFTNYRKVTEVRYYITTGLGPKVFE